jgi:hypothetical protein
MADLFNQQISATYSGLLKTTSSGVLTSSLTQITDGRGNGSPLYISTVAINFYNAYTFPSTDGTADQILSTDGAGAITWVDVSGGDVLKTGTIVANEIAIWNDNDSTLRSDPTLTIDADHNITLYQPNSVPTDLSNYNIGGGNINTVTGTNNTGFGKDNLNSVTTGDRNIAFGGKSLENNITGIDNVAVGYFSLNNNTSSSNVAVGSGSMQWSTTGSSNVAVGNGSMSGVSGFTTGSSNVAVGNNSMLLITSGDVNTAIGSGSGGSLTSGSYNVLIGGGNAITTGSSNVVIGRDDGSSIYNLSNRIIISDGAGNIRQTFDNSGNATFNSSVGIGTATVSSVGKFNIDSGTGDTSSNDTIQTFTRTSSTGNVLAAKIVLTAPSTYQQNLVFKIKSTASGAENPAYYTDALTIASTGAATFSSSVTATQFQLSAASGQYYYFDNASGNNFLGLTATNTLGLYVGGNLSLSVGSTGAATFSNDVTTTGASQNLFIADGSTYSGFKLNRAGTAKWTIFNNNAGTDFLDFYWYGSSPGTKFKIEPTGAATFSGQINANNGISFPNASVSGGTIAATPLNAYEEGTFDPTFFGTDLTISSYGNRYGYYTRVGRLVTITINIMTQGLTAIGTQDVKIGGLPFTSSSVVESTNSINIFNSSRWDANPPINGYVDSGQSFIYLYINTGATGAGTDPTTAKTSDMATGSGNRNMVRLTATYFV